jgi:hypothetical protein
MSWIDLAGISPACDGRLSAYRPIHFRAHLHLVADRDTRAAADYNPVLGGDGAAAVTATRPASRRSV